MWRRLPVKLYLLGFLSSAVQGLAAGSVRGAGKHHHQASLDAFRAGQSQAKQSAWVSQPVNLSIGFTGTTSLKWSDYKRPQDNVSAAEKILYVVYSDSQFYDTRVKWVLSTWGKDIPRSEFLVVGDTEPEEDIGARVRRTSCEAHTHDGACCKVAKALLFAREEMRRKPYLKWVYFTDDDVYVRKDALQQLLASQPPSDASSTGLALGGFVCGSGEAPCFGRLCGGGGVVLDQKAVITLAESRYGPDQHSFLQDVMSTCPQCGNFGDISFSSTFSKVGLTRKRLYGLMGSTVGKPCMDILNAGKWGYESIMFHVVREEQQMKVLHRLYSVHEEPSVGALVAAQLRAYRCVTYRERTVCADSDEKEDTPWVPVHGGSC